MSNEPNQPKEPGKDSKPLLKIIWLFFAFFPSTIAIVCFKTNNVGLFPVLIILNLFCSIVSGLGLIHGIKNKFAATVVPLRF
jgi:hypothetical protein